jgi:hypothetical protein
MAKKKAAVPRETETDTIKMKPVQRGFVRLSITGLSPVITHAWSEKALRMMREKKQGKKTKDREPCNPEEEVESASYRTADGRYGIPLTAVKAALITAAHKDLGVEKTLVKKAIFILDQDASGVVPLVYKKREGREDPVRVGMGSADLRYRPYYYDWSAEIVFEVNHELLTIGDLVNLIDSAGFGVGICEWRPEKGGEFGRFKVDPKSIICAGTLDAVA